MNPLSTGRPTRTPGDDGPPPTANENPRHPRAALRSPDPHSPDLDQAKLALAAGMAWGPDYWGG